MVCRRVCPNDSVYVMVTSKRASKVGTWSMTRLRTPRRGVPVSLFFPSAAKRVLRSRLNDVRSAGLRECAFDFAEYGLFGGRIVAVGAQDALA